jgi:SPP1 gp7 family putative phage head morphogenesis protein
MPKTPQALIEIATRHQIYLEGHKTHLANEFGPFLQKMARVIDKRLATDITDFNRDRLEKLLLHVQGDLRDVYRQHFKVWREQVVDLAEYEAGFEIRSLKQVIDTYDFQLPSRTQLKSAVFSTPLAGLKGADKAALLPSFYKGWSERTITQVEGIIRGGYYQGLTTPQIVRQIKGTAGAGFRDGQLARGNKDITMLTRTAVQHASGQARNETWKANSDIIRAVRIVAAIDDRTTEQCRSLDGTEWPIDEGPRPPFHIGCRTTTVPALDARFAMLDDGATRAVRDPETGRVEKAPAEQTYYQWLKRQDPEVQDSIIGPTRGTLLRDGGLSSERFAELNLNSDFKPRTLDQMRELEPLAFKRAGV